MRQQINIEIIMEADAEISAGVIEDCIFEQLSQTDSDRTEVLSVTAKEEAQIYGTDEEQGYIWDIQDTESLHVHCPGSWENDTGPEGWYAISDEDGIKAYAGTEEIAFQIKNAALKDDKALQIIEAFLALDDWSDDAIAPRGLVKKAQAFVAYMKGGAA